uniref:Glutamate-rich WD repeat-containing protein 1 n=1 Tax=Syntrichia ruralis TaxID=38588 RepID=Q8GTM1_SYNRU|nr:WD40 [Syntrichia ruralis]
MARTKKKAQRGKTIKKKKEDVEEVEMMEEDGSGPSQPQQQQGPTKVWQPGVDEMADDEELQFDPTAYHCLHSFKLGWPCLSFDIMRDDLGVLRRDFPHSLQCVAGTQADQAGNNAIAVVRMTNITGKIPKAPSATMDEDGQDSDSESSDDEDEEEVVPEQPGAPDQPVQSKKPIFKVRLVAHQGCVNRVRAMTQQSNIVATWADTGYVQVWDMAAHLRSMATSGPDAPGQPSTVRQAPLHIFTGHKDEGYALDWSPITAGRLLSGDCKSAIHLWEPTPAGKWVVEKAPYTGHTASVEDLQWSPTEADVFASCSVDQTLRIWDTRTRSGSAIAIKAHNADINVISWNRLVSCMLASGCDDGTFRIWDLRNFKEDSFVAHFKYHTLPITSIEWSPHEQSTLSVTSADHQLTIWDLSLERDPEEEAVYQAQLKQNQAEAPEDLPPQLLFVTTGQKDLKECHWHPQIQGMLMSTAGDGFNILRPSNLDNLPAL